MDVGSSCALYDIWELVLDNVWMVPRTFEGSIVDLKVCQECMCLMFVIPLLNVRSSMRFSHDTVS
jgi:hypothetical protein